MIRELHAMLCRSQDTYVVHTDVGRQERPLPKGEYEQFPNNPTSLATGRLHYYAPPELVAPEMHRLVASLSSEEYRHAHPVVQSAYLHYSVAAIHPFADGNGRTARAVASVPLYRALRVPFMVLRDERDAYLDALGAADAGDVAAYVHFVTERVIDVSDLVRTTITAGTSADRARSLEALRQASLVGGMTDPELDALAARVTAEIATEIRQERSTLRLPKGATFDIKRPSVRPPVPTGFRRSARGWRVRLESGGKTAITTIEVFVAKQPGGPVLRLTASEGYVLDLTVRDVAPFRDITKVKIAHWTAGIIDAALAALAEAVAPPT
jgi:hypothetical protein